MEANTKYCSLNEVSSHDCPLAMIVSTQDTCIGARFQSHLAGENEGHFFFAITNSKAWFKRRILHAPNQILILVDSNEYVRLI